MYKMQLDFTRNNFSFKAFFYLIISFLLVGCVSIEDFDKKSNEAISLRRDLETSQNKIRSLQAIRDSLNRKIKKNSQINEELEQQLTMSWRKKQKDTVKMSDLRSQISRQKRLKNENKNKIDQLNLKLENSKKAKIVLEKNLTKIRKRLIRFEDKIRLQNQVFKDLKNQFSGAIKKNSIKILRKKQRVVIRIASKILFRSGRAKVKKNSKPLLRKIASVIKRYSNREIQVQGHTDNVQIKGQLAERWETNWELSTARATSVLRYLVEIGDVDPRNSSAAGLGEFNPIATNNSKKGKSLNRRIEIIIFPPNSR